MRARRSFIARWGGASGAAVVLMLSMAATALAVSILLPVGGHVVVPPTTAATEPSLVGNVIHNALLPFKISAPGGAVLCAGQLQNEVVRSSTTGLFDFYYRIRGTSGAGAIAQIRTASFTVPLRVAYRTDGLGTVAPRLATRTPAPGLLITFVFDPTISCAAHQESRLILIKTPAKVLVAGGDTEVIATTGARVLLGTAQP